MNNWKSSDWKFDEWCGDFVELFTETAPERFIELAEIEAETYVYLYYVVTPREAVSNSIDCLIEDERNGWLE